jgi:aspartate kinase
MMTADPRVCSDAQNIDSIGFEEAAELAHFGAKVLHPKTLQAAIERNIPVYVLNSRRPENCGTRVEAKLASNEARVKSIACKRGIVLAEVLAKQGLDAKLTASIFQAVEEQKCLVDLAAMSRTNLSLLLSSMESASALATSLEAVAEVRITPDLALVSLVGQNVARDPIISARAMNALPDLPVRMIFHGASDMNLSFVVHSQDADRAVRALHRALFSSDGDVSQSAEIVRQSLIGREAVNVGEA